MLPLRPLLFLLTVLSARLLPGAEARQFVLMERTLPPAEFVWQSLRILESMTSAELVRTASEFLEARQLGAPVMDSERLLLIAWAERDAHTALQFASAGLRLESENPWREERVSESIPLLAALLCRFAADDWKKALSCLTSCPATDAGVLYRQRVAWLWQPELKRLSSFLESLTVGVSSEDNLRRITEPILWASVQRHSWKATSRAAASLRYPTMRKIARERLAQLKSAPPLPQGKPAPRRNSSSRKIRELLQLSASSALAPLGLRRAVVALPCPEAAALRDEMITASVAPDDPAVWMLTMHAANDPTLSAGPSADSMIAGVRAQQTAAALHPRRPAMDAAAFVTELRNISSPSAVRDALSGFLLTKPGQDIIRGQLGSPLMAFAGELQLPAMHWRPSLLAAVREGAGPAALSYARSLPGETPSSLRQLRIELLSVWALINYGSFLREAPAACVPEECSRALASAAPWLPVSIVAGAPMEFLDTLPDAWWESLALSDPERGYTLLETSPPSMAGAVRAFAAGAIRTGPERVVNLIRRKSLPESEWPLDRMLFWHPEQPKKISPPVSAEAWELQLRQFQKRFPIRDISVLRTPQESRSGR